MTSATEPTVIQGVQIYAPMEPGYDEVLTDEAVDFVADLTRRFAPRLTSLLKARRIRQERINAGQMPDFMPQTVHIRSGDWHVTSIPKDLQDRRVEITGPVDRKMIINALNSGAKVFMADFEDSLTPTWQNIIQGQLNLRDAVKGTIEFTSPEGKKYSLNKETATLIVRPRGWHLPEKHMRVEGREIPGPLLDFGLYVFHNAKALLKKGSGPYFYLPKLESYAEAKLWADIFGFVETKLGLPDQSIKVTVLIETILAAFEIDEILHELRNYIVGLNCGRWDYIFSVIKKFQQNPDFILPDRNEVVMTTHFLHSYSLLVIKTCHKRKAHAIGGMAAQIPIKSDPQANEIALAKVRADKEREASDGHDGTWVAHPGLVPIAMEIFDKHMPEPNQLDRLREDVEITAQDLLEIPEGSITEQGLRTNISVAIQYMAAWLDGNGCVPLYNLMEDAATAEISRAQIWQWVHHDEAALDDGRHITLALFDELLEDEMAKIEQEVGGDAFSRGSYHRAADLLKQITYDEKFEDFLTLVAYQAIN